MKRLGLTFGQALMAIVLCAHLGAVSAHADTHWELLETSGSAQVTPGSSPTGFLSNASHPAGPSWSYSDSANDSLTIGSIYPIPEFDPFADVVYVWASAEMGLSAEDCELETSINVSANIGLFEGGVEFGVFNPDPQAAIDFLQGNAITPFQINYAAKANFEARVFEPCGGDIPCGLFEVDMGDGEFVPYCGPIEGEWTVRLAGDAAEISGSFIWNGVTLENGGPTTKEINTKIGVPEPSSALLVALSMGGLFFCRPRQG